MRKYAEIIGKTGEASTIMRLVDICGEVPLTDEFLNALADAGIGANIEHKWTDADGVRWSAVYTRIE